LQSPLGDKLCRLGLGDNPLNGFFVIVCLALTEQGFLAKILVFGL
jgi:hypothetical protein